MQIETKKPRNTILCNGTAFDVILKDQGCELGGVVVPPSQFGFRFTVQYTCPRTRVHHLGRCGRSPHGLTDTSNHRECDHFAEQRFQV